MPHLLLLMGAWCLGRGGSLARRELAAAGGDGCSPFIRLTALPFAFFRPGSAARGALFPTLLACLWSGGEGGAGEAERGLMALLESRDVPLEALASFMEEEQGGSATPLALRLECRLPPSAIASLAQALKP